MDDSSNQSDSVVAIPPGESRAVFLKFGWMVVAAVLLAATAAFLLYETVINPGAAFRRLTSQPHAVREGARVSGETPIVADQHVSGPVPGATDLSARTNLEYPPDDPFETLAGRANQSVPGFRSLAELAADEERLRAVERERRLRADLRVIYAQTIERFKVLELGVADFRKSVDRTLGYSPTSTEPQPAELDRAILSHESVAEALADIKNFFVQVRDIEEKRETLANMSSRLNRGPVTLMDKSDLQTMNAWIDEQSDRLSAQRANLEHIRVMLEVERSENRLDSSDGRP